MKCQILFSGKNKKNNIILSSAENAQRVVKVKVFLCLCVCGFICGIGFALYLFFIPPSFGALGRLCGISWVSS